MTTKLDPIAVAARLAILRALYVPETVADARRRLAKERPADDTPFAEKVARRLDELRALDDFARYLQQAKHVGARR